MYYNLKNNYEIKNIEYAKMKYFENNYSLMPGFNLDEGLHFRSLDRPIPSPGTLLLDHHQNASEINFQREYNSS